MSIQFECCGRTDIGGRRDNQDHFLIADTLTAVRIGPTSTDLAEGRIFPAPPLGKLLAVADGLGGHVAGELASRLVLETLVAELSFRWPQLMAMATTDDAAIEGVLDGILRQCQTRLLTSAADRPATFGMGTTLTFAFVIWPRVLISHVGDSRAYLARGGWIEQLTTDHTLAALANAAGTSALDAPLGTHWEHVLLNCVGANRSAPRGEFHRMTLQPGDALLLCSDGLVRQDGDEQLFQEVIAGAQDIAAACDQLVDQAKARGVRDNITAVIARFREARTETEQRAPGTGDQPAGLKVSRLKSTSEWPQQSVA
jgi:protein phosphatase